MGDTVRRLLETINRLQGALQEQAARLPREAAAARDTQRREADAQKGAWSAHAGRARAPHDVARGAALRAAARWRARASAALTARLRCAARAQRCARCAWRRRRSVSAWRS
jgi:hypothetical protein